MDLPTLGQARTLNQEIRENSDGLRRHNETEIGAY